MELARLAVPSVYVLIAFLSFSSQILFLHLEPHPPTRKQILRFNVLVVCLLVSYTKSVFVDPGHVPKTYGREEEKDGPEKRALQPRKWCQKCDAAKPPRAHHCRECKRCVPKMDHHCPWTANCVSHTTYPHFMRFLFYAVMAMVYLTGLLWTRVSHLWANRALPSYLGPSALQLAHLFSLCVANFVTLFALSILLVRNIWCLAVNTTTIEGWEIERHKTLVRRAKYFGGWLDGPEGKKIRIQKQEFPYDIGIWKNFKQGMGTGNVLAWFWPLAASPAISSGLDFETNGFEDPSVTWPPPDPDRIHRKFPKGMDKAEEGFTYRDAGLSAEDTLAAFKKRQQDDAVRRRRPFLERVEAQQRAGRAGDDDAYEYGSEAEEDEAQAPDTPSGEEGWTNSEGERLRDFGLDEDAEFYDEEDDLPLSELLARRRAGAAPSVP